MHKITSSIYNQHSKELIENVIACESDFLKFIQMRLGIYIHLHQENDLFKTVLEACEKLHCQPQDYLERLRQAPDNSSLFDCLVGGITVGETYFFRDKHQGRLLENIILPEIIARKYQKKNKTIRIWSAGCSTGEEIYTIAILLNEILTYPETWTLQLLGTDINTTALQQAVAGRYKKWSMRGISPEHLNKYFLKEDHEYILSEKIRNLVRFSYLNLNADNYPSILNGTNDQDLILCRNVLIYFDNGRIDSIMKKISACLVETGYLLLGATDPINIADSDLQCVNNQGIYFIRPPKEYS
jgi:chemotaxis protein methyltransferase CheR